MQTPGLHPLTPTVALEHHRGVKGTGYPDLGHAIPHPMSQIVSVADIYEAITGARTYQDPTPPERACLIMARLAGEKLNTALVKTFVNAITFFPLGSLVRTNRNELGLVIETNRGEPLHPVITRARSAHVRADRAREHRDARLVRRLRAAHQPERAGARRTRCQRNARGSVIVQAGVLKVRPALRLSPYFRLKDRETIAAERSHPVLDSRFRPRPCRR